MAVAIEQVRMPSAVRELAQALLPTTAELARGMTAHLYQTIPELAAGEDEELRRELFASAEANIAQVLWLLRRGASLDEIVVPAEALEYMRSNVRRGIPLPALLRSYRLGHAWLWERWSQALTARIADAGELGAGRELSSSFMFAYVDRLSDAVVEEFGTELQRTRRDTAQLRRATVRTILEGAAVDVEAASARLSYELARNHVALRVSSSASELPSLETAVASACAALGPGKPLAVPSGAASFDVWWGSFDPPATEGLEAFVPPAGVEVSFGRPAAGVEGFSRSHSEAVEASRIAALARGAELGASRAAGARGTVTSYERVELVSLLASDLSRARAFVARELGALAAGGEPAGRLRETVLAFLLCAGSATRAARTLHVHQNTVAYRVKRAQEMLGRAVDERPAELMCALMLAAALGQTVLEEDPEGAR